MPFTFDDLAEERGERREAGFVCMFNTDTEEPEPAEVEEAALSPEDQARKVFEDAYAEGEKAGYDMGMRRAELVAKRLERQVDEVVRFKGVLEERCEKLACELALVFAEAIILRECTVGSDVVAGMIRKALTVCEERGEIVIRVRNEDLPRLAALGSGNVRVIADDGLKEPGFVIETSAGEIDGRIGSQIEELRNALSGYRDG